MCALLLAALVYKGMAAGGAVQRPNAVAGPINMGEIREDADEIGEVWQQLLADPLPTPDHGPREE